MYQSVELLIPIAAMSMVFGIVYVGVTAQNRKNLAMIEAGMNPNKKDQSEHSKIRKILLLILIPIGIILGHFIGDSFNYYSNQTTMLFGFIFGGIALGISYIIDRKINKEKTELLD